MNVAVIIILVGILLIIAEIIFIPGTTIVGFVGAAFCLAGIGKIYLDAGTFAGNIALASTVIFIGIVFFALIRFNVWSGLALKETIDGRVNEHNLDLLSLGETGVTKSALRPVGKALIQDKEYEVQTLGHYVAENTQIRIIQIKQSKIIVEPLES